MFSSYIYSGDGCAHSEYTKNHRLVPYKMVEFLLWELYLNLKIAKGYYKTSCGKDIKE